MDHEKYMRRCLELAVLSKSKGKTAVGSLLVKNNQVISEGAEAISDLPSPLQHAEIIAITQAITATGINDLSDCYLYSTVEPCIMCSYAIRETKIGHVIFGTNAGDIGGVFSNNPILTLTHFSRWALPPEVVPGILEVACRKVLRKGKRQ